MSNFETNTPTPQSETNTAAIEQMHRDYEAMQLQEAQTTSPLDQSFDDAFAIEAASVGKRYVEETPIQPKKMSDSLKEGLIYTGVGTALIATAAAGITGLASLDDEVEKAPTFSTDTTTYPVGNGEGLYDAAESIPGINTIDVRDAVQHISVDPANIDVLKDGLQAGEQLVVPISINGVESSNE